MMMNRPKRSPRKKQSPSFVYTDTVKRSRRGVVESTSVSGSQLSEKTETTAKSGAKKRLTKPSTSATGMKKVVKKLFLNKRKRSPKQKMESAESNNDNNENCSDSVSVQLETLVTCDDDESGDLGCGDAPQKPKIKFLTNYLQTWKETFQAFYHEQHVKGVVCALETSHIERGIEICMKKDSGTISPSDWVAAQFSGSQVTLHGYGLEEWKANDFPALTERVKKKVAGKADKQKACVASPAKKRSRLSLKSVRGGRLDGASVPKLAPLFKKCAAQKDGKQPEDAKSGNGKGMKGHESGDAKDTPCVAALHNLGNTCFLSSVLQVLRYTPGFVDNISKLAEEVNLCDNEDIDNDNEEDNLTWTLISNLDQLYEDMHTAESKVSRGENSYLAVRPYQLMESIEKLNPMFEGNLQQDAHELLRCLLTYVQDATKAVNKHRKTRKMAAATARFAQPVKKYDTNSDDEIANIVAGAVRSVMCIPKPADRDNADRSCHEEMISDPNPLVKCEDIKQDLSEGVLNGFKDEMSSNLGSGHTLGRWTTQPVANHVAMGNAHITNGWGSMEESDKENLVYGSTGTFPKKIGNGNLTTPATWSGKVGKTSSPAKCDPSISPLKGQRSSHCLTTTKTLTRLVNGEYKNEKSTMNMNGLAKFEAEADLLSDKLKLLTQSKSDTNIGDLVHQRNNRWRSNSADDVHSCGHVTKKRRTRGMNVEQGHQTDIMDMFTRQITGSLTHAVNNDNLDLGSKERLRSCSAVGDKVTSPTISKNGVADTAMEQCPAKNASTQNTTWQQKKIIKKQTARKSAGNYHLNLSHHINDTNDGNKHEKGNRCSTICENEEVDSSSVQKDELLKSIALANGKLAVVQLRRSAVSDYFRERAAKEQVVDCIEDLFQGSMALRTRCLECEGSTERKEAYQDIGVPVRNERRDDDDEEEDDAENPHGWILAALDDVEKLQDDNKYVCETCCHLVEAERSMHYVTLPRILTLHLKRFAATSRCLGGVTKINDHVTTPMILPCIQDGCRESCTTPSHRYELYAVITHTGISISSGHYVAYVRMLPPSEKCGSCVDGSTNLQSKTMNCAIAVSNQNPGYPNGGDAIMADPNNNADTNNNVDIGPETTTNAMVSSIVAPSGGRSESSGNKTLNWYSCDDDVITVLTQDELECILAPSGGGSPYLLFYHKVGLLQESNIVVMA